MEGRPVLRFLKDYWIQILALAGLAYYFIFRHEFRSTDEVLGAIYAYLVLIVVAVWVSSKWLTWKKALIIIAGFIATYLILRAVYA